MQLLEESKYRRALRKIGAALFILYMIGFLIIGLAGAKETFFGKCCPCEREYDLEEMRRIIDRANMGKPTTPAAEPSVAPNAAKASN